MLPQLTILISGRGSNMQALHEACVNRSLNAAVSHVISNNSDAAGLDYARQHNIRTSVVDHRDFTQRSDFDAALTETILQAGHTDLIILAGFMRQLTATFTNRFAGRLINIHPSLLPRHPGLDTHNKALACGDTWHGCSVHFVNEELDAGALIARGVVPVLANDTESTLASRVLATEHRILPAVTHLLLHGELVWQDDHVKFKDITLHNPILYCYT